MTKSKNNTQPLHAEYRGDGDMPIDIAVEFRNVTKAFGSQVVLNNISCKLPKGRTTVIVGPSGTGKSVFLKLLVGLICLLYTSPSPRD